jgi:hypothetical protein
MTETFRDKEELLRIESETLRRAKEEVAHLKRRVKQHDEIMAEKGRDMQVYSIVILRILVVNILHCFRCYTMKFSR